MLKRYAILLLVLFLLLIATEGVSANNRGVIRVFLGQREILLDASPIIAAERVFVPMRNVFEALGATVEWQPHNRTIVARRKGQTITFGANSSSINVNGRIKTVDARPRIVRGRMFVPLRVVSQALGAQVNWNSKTRRVDITNGGSAADTSVISARVLSVINSNTMMMNVRGKTETIRLIGVGIAQKDRPRAANIPFGPENLDFIKDKIEGKTVWLTFDVFRNRDSEGRLFAYVWTEKPTENNEVETLSYMLNAILLYEGHAKFDLETVTPSYLMHLIRAERAAIDAKKGIWSEHHPDPTYNRNLRVLAINHIAEYILLKNENTMDIDISGWTITSDYYTQLFVFPQGTIIPVGESFKVVSGSNSQQGRFLWTTDNVWHDRRANAAIYNTEGLQTGGLRSSR